METLRATWLIFCMHLSSVLGSRRALVCLALAAMPPLLGFLALRFSDVQRPEMMLAVLAWFPLCAAVVPLCALVTGSAVVSEELENRTITYVFTRPTPRPALLFGRWLATLVAVVGFLGASVAALGLLALSQPFGEPEILHATLWRMALAVAMGGATYSLLFAVLGVFLRHPMIVGLGYTFAFEGLLANLPGETQSLSLQYYLRAILAADGRQIWADLYNMELAGLPTTGEALATLAGLLAFALVVGTIGISRRQYVLTS